MTSRETLAGRIERLRGLTGLSARELDALAGLRAGHVRLIETGRVRGRIEARTVSQIAAVFGVTIDWLFGGKGSGPSADEVRAAVVRAPRTARQKTGTSD